MKKLLALALALALAMSFVACGGSGSSSSSSSSAETQTYRLALVTDQGSVDDRSFNQGAWEGVVQYAEENDISYNYYRPISKDTDGYITAIEQAIDNGAEVVVCPGFLFEPAIYAMQDEHPDVNFILIDGRPRTEDYSAFKTGENVYSVIFAEEQSGFFAGYAAVMNGYREIGFMGGMAVPAVMRYGYGFVQGAEYAAKELGLAEGEVRCRYNYTGVFVANPDIQTMAAAWYADGTEVIFSCGGLIINSIAAAAEAADPLGAVIGVDTDQRPESDTVVTSAMKMLTVTVYDALVKWGNGEFQGGVEATLGVEADAVGLPEASFQYMENFTIEQYNALYAKMLADEDGIATSLIKDSYIDELGNPVTIDAAAFAEMMQLVKVDVIA